MKYPNTRRLLNDLAAILGSALLATLLLWSLNGDTRLAKWAHTPDASWAWALRQHGYTPAVLLAITALGFTLIPLLRMRFPEMRRLALVYLAAFIMGGGLMVGVLAKEAFPRFRPRESVLIEHTLKAQENTSPEKASKAQTAELKGKSFPSGHVATGAVLAVPFFVWRRKRPRLAKASLAIGLGAAAAIGAARMALGAHFLTDAIWSTAFVLASGAIAAHFITERIDFKTRYTIPIFLAILIGIALGNQFDLTLRHTLQAPTNLAKMGCKINLNNGLGQTLPAGTHVKVEMSGFGAPKSKVFLTEREGALRMAHGFGLYHSFECKEIFITSPAPKAP